MSMRRPHSAAPLVAALLLAACGDPLPATATAPIADDSVSLPAPDAGLDDTLRDVTPTSGITYRHVVADGALDNLIESVGAGVTVLDADGDGRLDLYFVDQGWREGISSGEPRQGLGKNRLYRNLGGMRFEDITDAAGVGDPGFGFMAVAADLDDDGDQDLYVLNDGPNVLYHNRGDGTFEDVTGGSGTAGNACSVGGAAFDANGDGLLDLYVGNYVHFDPTYRLHYAPHVFPGPLAFEPQPDVLLRNQGDGTFREASAASGTDVPAARAMGVSILDANADGHLDVFVANDATANFLFVSEGNGRFRETGALSGVAFGIQGEGTAAMAGVVGDVDGDGKSDLHVSDSGYGSLFRNDGEGRFVDRIVVSGIAAASGQWASWGGGFLDVDIDGVLDLYVANGDLHRTTGRPDLLFRGVGDGTFEDVSATSGAWFRAERMGRGAALADLDDDGRMDVVVCHVHDAPALLQGNAQTPHHFLTIDLVAKPRHASGIGARVVVIAGERRIEETAVPRSGYLAQGDARLLLGLGDVRVVDRVEITWPGGGTDVVTDVATDGLLVIRQGESVQ